MSDIQTEALAAITDAELEHQALYLSVAHPDWRKIWQEYERRGVGRIAQVLQRRDATATEIDKMHRFTI